MKVMRDPRGLVRTILYVEEPVGSQNVCASSIKSWTGVAHAGSSDQRCGPSSGKSR